MPEPTSAHHTQAAAPQPHNPNPAPQGAPVDAHASLTKKYPLLLPLEALDGEDLVLLMHAAHDWLAEHYEMVNLLNVFPVRDGDTGTNMLLTVRAAWSEAAASKNGRISVALKAAAQGALLGSRGNSGVIFSQILQGMSQTLATDERLSAHTLARALAQGAEAAYRCVTAPVEGTILTVIRMVSERAASLAPSITDLRTFFAHLVYAADQAVAHTPDLLPVLKQAGVVDSGGKGLYLILDGMHRALMGQWGAGADGPGADGWGAEPPGEMPRPLKGQRTLPPLQSGFDVQFLIERPSLSVDAIREAIAAMGDFPLIEGDQNLVKVHVHVADPGVPLSYAVKIGFVTDVVVENMDDQVAATSAAPSASASVTQTNDVAVDVDAIALVVVAQGEGFGQIFRALGVAALVDGGATMNPSTGELAEAISQTPNRRVLVLPNDANALPAAQQAADLVLEANPTRQVLVVPTKTTPQGIAAVLACNPTAPNLSQVVTQLQEHISQIDTGVVAQAARDAEFDGVTVEIGDFIGLHDGRLVTSSHTADEVVLSLLEQMAAEESDLITIYAGAPIAAGDAENLKEMVRSRYPDQEIELAFGGQTNEHYILSTE